MLFACQYLMEYSSVVAHNAVQQLAKDGLYQRRDEGLSDEQCFRQSPSINQPCG